MTQLKLCARDLENCIDELWFEIRLTYESASPMRDCEGIYLVKVRISFKLALDTQHLENLTI